MNFNIKKIKNSKETALLLGMFAGDGCLSVSRNGEGYRIYPIRFFNTNKTYVELFSSLFYSVFEKTGKIRGRKRVGKKMLWEFEVYSVEIYKIINIDLEIACGKKALSVRIPGFIRNGSIKLKKHFFLGLLITDGGIRSDGTVTFHAASKQLIYDIKDLIDDLWGINVPVKEYIQRERFKSYQLNLNKGESSSILDSMPTWDNLVLRRT